MARVYVDLDDVLSQTALAFTRLLAESFDKHVALEEITSFDLSESFDLTDEELGRFMLEAHQPQRLLAVEPMPGAIDVLSAWQTEGYDVDVLTGRPPASGEVSRRWLHRHHMAHSELYFVDKYARYDESAWEGHEPVLQLAELHGDAYEVIVEDSLETAAYMAENTSARILLIDKPWNRDISKLPEATGARLERCADWSEIRRRF